MVMGWEPNKFTVNRGEQLDMALHMLDPQDKEPMNLSGITAISILIKKADKTLMEKAVVGGFVVGQMCPLYIYSFTLTQDDTQLLPVGKDQPIMVKLTYADKVYQYVIAKALTVQDISI